MRVYSKRSIEVYCPECWAWYALTGRINPKHINYCLNDPKHMVFNRIVFFGDKDGQK